MIGLLAALAFAANWTPPDFPDWMDSSSRAAMEWKAAVPDTFPREAGTWYVVVDSPEDPLGRDSLVSLSVRPHPLLSAVFWPIDKVVNPTARVVLTPLKVPVLYGERIEVVDRGVLLARLDSSTQTMIYPTMVMDGGTGSRLGGTVLSNDLFHSSWYGRASGAFTIARDWYLGVNALSPPFGMGNRLRARVAAAKFGETSIRIPGWYPMGSTKSVLTVREERVSASSGVSIPLGRLGGIEPNWTGTWRRAAAPERGGGNRMDLSEIPWFSRGNRGIRGEEWSQQIQLVWYKGNRDFEGIPTDGGHQSVAVQRVSSHGGGDAFTLSVEGSRFFLLGDEKYVYRKEDLEPYLDISPETIVRLLDPSTLRRRLTQRRVLASMARVSRMWELDPSDPVTYYQFPTMGGSAPARAYGGGRLMGKFVAGGALEYRWPIWRYIDGAVFGEMAWVGDDLLDFDFDRLAPGTGGGIRVRTKTMFLFRVFAAYGREGGRFVATVSQEF
ncbi:MAG: hypothetical protein H6686_06660 [Fibrobacteria bacterium]|nr:hypothetical protein [Fibrobacteria bacterium]